MIPRPDLVHPMAPEGVEVFQLTNENVPSSHVYMEAQIFAPDSRRFVLHRSAHPHGSDKKDPEHRYLLCDLDNDGELTPLTFETGATAPSVSPDGRYLYYLVDETELGGGRLTLRRVRLDGTERETLVVLDTPLPGTYYRPSRMYPLSTISSDGKRLATSCYLGDGEHEEIANGLIVFDIPSGEVWAPLVGPTWGNVHAQYCRSLDPRAARDILVQEDHDRRYDTSGRQLDPVRGLGIEIHVIRDDGTAMRNLPWGRDGNERCQGHQCWIGRSTRALTSTVLGEPDEQQVIEGNVVPFAGHVGLQSPGGYRNNLTRDHPAPHFYHFATDIAGDRFIVDCSPRAGQHAGVYVARIPDDGHSPLVDLTPVADPKSSWRKDTHVHPFLSPDGRAGFFNSDESGTLQAYMVRGW